MIFTFEKISKNILKKERGLKRRSQNEFGKLLSSMAVPIPKNCVTSPSFGPCFTSFNITIMNLIEIHEDPKTKTNICGYDNFEEVYVITILESGTIFKCMRLDMS